MRSCLCAAWLLSSSEPLGTPKIFTREATTASGGGVVVEFAEIFTREATIASGGGVVVEFAELSVRCVASELF